jgi:hypothetical protein
MTRTKKAGLPAALTTGTEYATVEIVDASALWALADEIEALPFKARAAQLPRIIRAIAVVLK